MSNSNVNQTFTLKILLRILNRQKSLNTLKQLFLTVWLADLNINGPKQRLSANR